MTAVVTWEADPPVLADDAVRDAVAAALREGGAEGRAVSVAFVSDATLAELHGRFLDDPSPTDVMSFPLGEGDDGPWGEVVVSVDRAREVAAERGVPFESELLLYVVHGTLHLCGHDDHDDAERAAMRDAEARVLAALDVPHERFS